MLEQRIAYLCQARCFCNFLYTLLVLIAACSCTPRWVRTSSTEKMSVVYFLFLFFGYCLVQLTSRTLFGSSTFFLHLPSRQHMHMNESIHCNFIIFCLADVPIEFTHISSAQIAFVTTEICTKRSQKQFVDILTEKNPFPNNTPDMRAHNAFCGLNDSTVIPHNWLYFVTISKCSEFQNISFVTPLHRLLSLHQNYATICQLGLGAQ